jgi:heme-degrading monooxygenase HmoA
MFLHMSIHKPHPHATEDLAASMHRFGEALRTQPGLVEVQAFKTADGELIGLALWESRAAWELGRHAGREAVQNDPFDEWESAPVVGYAAESIDTSP